MKIPTTASRHPEGKPQTHGPGWKWAILHSGWVQGSLPQDGNGKHGIPWVWGLPDLDGRVRLQGIAFPAPHRWSRCRVTLTNKRGSSPIRSGGGDPYRMVRIRCESGVRIKIPESGFKNPDPDAFAFNLVRLADPDHVRIQNHLHFLFWWIFLQIRTQGSGSGFASHLTALEKF